MTRQPISRSHRASEATRKLVTVRRFLFLRVTTIRTPFPKIMRIEMIGRVTCFRPTSSFILSSVHRWSAEDLPTKTGGGSEGLDADQTNTSSAPKENEADCCLCMMQLSFN